MLNVYHVIMNLRNKNKMAQSNYTIDVKIWDEWEIDTFSSNGYLCYILVEIAGKLQLMEKYLNEL